jgi:hypothetical protein
MSVGLKSAHAVLSLLYAVLPSVLNIYLESTVKPGNSKFKGPKKKFLNYEESL